MDKKERDVFSVANDKVKAVKAYIGQNIVSLLALASMIFIFLFVSIMDFAEMKVEWQRLQNRQFWINYGLLLALGLVMFFIACAYGKSKQKATDKILDAKEALFILKNYLIDNCLEGEFSAYLTQKNRACKLERYKGKMRLIAYYAPMRWRARYIDRANSATLDNLDSLHFRYKEPYSAELIFNNVPTRKTVEAKAQYTGREGMTSWVLPTMMWMIFIQGALLSVAFSEKTSTLDTWIHLLAKVWTMLLFAVRGVSYGVYSVEDIFYSVLENRKGLVTEFLASKGINIVIKDNEHYKFKVVEVNPADLPINKEANNG